MTRPAALTPSGTEAQVSLFAGSAWRRGSRRGSRWLPGRDGRDRSEALAVKLPGFGSVGLRTREPSKVGYDEPAGAEKAGG